jgi:hypothetical protein
MKAITVQQPYAQLIAVGLKKHETRKTQALRSVVGQRIAIHCGLNLNQYQTFCKSLHGDDMSAQSWEIEHALLRIGCKSLEQPISWRYNAGRIIATAYVNQCFQIEDWHLKHETALERACGYWNVGYWAYQLTDIERLKEPITARGNVTLWEEGEIVCAPR